VRVSLGVHAGSSSHLLAVGRAFSVLEGPTYNQMTLQRATSRRSPDRNVTLCSSCIVRDASQVEVSSNNTFNICPSSEVARGERSRFLTRVLICCGARTIEMRVKL
jgi:hypothetical protein